MTGNDVQGSTLDVQAWVAEILREPHLRERLRLMLVTLQNVEAGRPTSLLPPSALKALPEAEQTRVLGQVARLRVGAYLLGVAQSRGRRLDQDTLVAATILVEHLHRTQVWPAGILLGGEPAEA